MGSMATIMRWMGQDHVTCTAACIAGAAIPVTSFDRYKYLFFKAIKRQLDETIQRTSIPSTLAQSTHESICVLLPFSWISGAALLMRLAR